MEYKKTLQKLAAWVLLMPLGGCAVTPRDLDTQGEDYSKEFVRLVKSTHGSLDYGLDDDFSLEGDFKADNAPLLSVGDLVKVHVNPMPSLNGVYQINNLGELELPMLEKGVSVNGLTTIAAQNRITQTLVQAGWFKSSSIALTISMVKASSVIVSVSGAVFNSGRVTINAEPALKPQENLLQEAGEFAEGRDLSSAIRAAGGLRPDADLTNVRVIRGGRSFRFNLEPLVNGKTFMNTPSLVQGDIVTVASTGQENPNLIRPSQVTPPGMRVLISNLTAPTLSNALSSVSADSTRLPYGTSLLGAAISANCVGGTHYANASRTVILVTRHHGSNQQIVIKRSVNELLAKSSQHLANPFVMPDDGLACYDSRFTNWRDVARGIGEIFGPAIIGRLL